jgi:hypothetical protein
MMARGFYYARRGYLALSLAIEPSDVAGFIDSMGAVVESVGF